MFTTNDKSNRYYIFDLKEYKYIGGVFYFDELIDYLASFQLEDSLLNSKYNNTILDNINLNFKDTKANFCWQCAFGQPNHECELKIQQLRRYVILDGLDRIIDIRYYLEHIKKVNKQNLIKKDYYNLSPWDNYIIKILQKYVGLKYEGPKFRKEPVPFTGQRKYSFSCRKIKTTNERRQSCDKEIKQYIRCKRNKNNLPTLYDSFIDRHNDKCWKTQSKNKKQWMK